MDRLVNKIIDDDCIKVMNTMGDKSVDMILTDIPYGEVSKNGADRAKYAGQLRSIDKGKADSVTFDLDAFLEECSRISNGGIYIFCGIEQVGKVYTYFDNHKDFMVRQCAWRKTNPSPSNGQHMWLSSFENCIFAKRRRTKFNRRCKSSVWDFPVGRGKVHPTEKPLNLFTYLVESSSDEGDVVFDPCIGSGTTAVAAINTDRNFIGIEREPEYVEIARKRINEAKEKRIGG